MQIVTFRPGLTGHRLYLVITRAYSRLSDRLLPLRHAPAEGPWIRNRSGHQAFRARAFRAKDGTWRGQVTFRTGWHAAEYRYGTLNTAAGHYRRRRDAFRAASLLAGQMATLRCRFN
ncbi:Uncharacterised protein [Cedecea neteri]|uniref:Uncharacterized protein n=1 Tax=Cedecea neteri TaxID=158822 RepID=A0A291E3K0_9ENTR|nr:hypothetical protein [Cedecea neteri]ATF94486.1 hypothetical protein CO704_21500 [Cedecea neteri]SQA97909.1 Uncharacterised protein [Cedecea neteri]